MRPRVYSTSLPCLACVLFLVSQKKAGNDAFMAGRYEDAIAAYRDCLALDPLDDNPSFNAKLYCNL